MQWTNLKKSPTKIGVKKAGQRVARLGKVAWRKTLKEASFSAIEEQALGFRLEIYLA